MSLQKKATDNLVQQLLNQIGDHAHVIGPGARVDVLDSIYVGRLIDLLEEAFPGTPSAVFHKVNPSLIVMTRDLSPPNTSVVRFTDSRLRIPDLTPGQKRDWSDMYGPLTRSKLIRGKHLDADLLHCQLIFTSQFFAPRSLVAWAKLAREFARMTAAWVDLKKVSGLQQKYVENEGTDSHLIFPRLVESRGEEEVDLELAPL